MLGGGPPSEVATCLAQLQADANQAGRLLFAASLSQLSAEDAQVVRWLLSY